MVELLPYAIIAGLFGLVGLLIWRLVARAQQSAKSEVNLENLEANQKADNEAKKILEAAPFGLAARRALARERRRMRKASAAKLHDSRGSSDNE